jgi:hypothetical protein
MAVVMMVPLLAFCRIRALACIYSEFCGAFIKLPNLSIKAIQHEGKGMVFMVCASAPHRIRLLAIRCVTLLDIIKFSQSLIPQKKKVQTVHIVFVKCLYNNSECNCNSI